MPPVWCFHYGQSPRGEFVGDIVWTPKFLLLSEAVWLKLHCCCHSRVDGSAVGGRTAPLSLVLLGKWGEGGERGYYLAVGGRRWCCWENKGTLCLRGGWGDPKNWMQPAWPTRCIFSVDSCLLHPCVLLITLMLPRGLYKLLCFLVCKIAQLYLAQVSLQPEKQPQRLFERGLMKPWKAT